MTDNSSLISNLNFDGKIIIIGFIFVILIIFTFCLNVYIIIIIAITKKLHKPINIFILSLSVNGIFVSIISMPLHAEYYLRNFSWYHGLWLCIIWSINDFSTGTISLLHFIFIAFIRYKLIVKPRCDWASKKLQILTLCLVWIVPISTWSLTLAIVIYQNEPISNDCYLTMNIPHAILADIFSFLLPLIVLVFINIKMINKLRKHVKKVANINANSHSVNEININDARMTDTQEINKNGKYFDELIILTN